jgi:Viral coat protein P2 N-terminal domain
MDRILKQCNPVQGATWGQTPTLDLTLGPRYRSLLLEILVTNANGNIPTILDVLDLITVKIGGVPQRQHTAWELDQVNKSFGAQYGLNAYKTTSGALTYTNGVPDAPAAGNVGGTIGTAFYLPIFFREPWRASYASREMFGWYTSWQDGSVVPSMTVEMKIPALGANILAASGITINGWAETDNAVGPLDANKAPVAQIMKWKRRGLNFGGPGDLVELNFTKREIYSQISLLSAYHTGKGPMLAAITPAALITDQNDLTAFDPITRVKVEVDGRTVRDATKVLNDQSLVDDDFNESGLPADRYDVVFDKSDNPADGLVMQAGGQTVNELKVTITVGLGTATQKIIQSISQVYGAIER